MAAFKVKSTHRKYLSSVSSLTMSVFVAKSFTSAFVATSFELAISVTASFASLDPRPNFVSALYKAISGVFNIFAKLKILLY